MSDDRGPFAKVYASMWDGTLGTNWQAWTTFVWMLPNCKRGGIVDVTPEKIADRSGLPLEVVEAGIRILESPDPKSRTPDEEGRRIVRLEGRAWGWRIVNLAQYREMTAAERAASYRARQGLGPGVAFVTESHAASRGVTPENHADSDSEADADPPPLFPPTESAARRRAPPDPVVAVIPCRGEKSIEIRESNVAGWLAAYPAVDVRAQLPRMVEWCKANPKKCWTVQGALAGVNNWLAKQQDREASEAARSASPRRNAGGHRAGPDARYMAANADKLGGRNG